MISVIIPFSCSMYHFLSAIVCEMFVKKLPLVLHKMKMIFFQEHFVGKFGAIYQFR